MHQLGRTLGTFKIVHEKEMGISGLAVMIMLELARQDGVTQNHLTYCTRVDPSMITRVVKELEQERGWIRRERDAEDNRLMRVFLTEAGREQAAIVPAKAAAIEQRLTQRLTVEDLQDLRRILSHLEEAARHDYEGYKEEVPD